MLLSGLGFFEAPQVRGGKGRKTPEPCGNLWLHSLSIVLEESLGVCVTHLLHRDADILEVCKVVTSKAVTHCI